MLFVISVLSLLSFVLGLGITIVGFTCVLLSDDPLFGSPGLEKRGEKLFKRGASSFIIGLIVFLLLLGV
jgi:hypothetical protein